MMAPVPPGNLAEELDRLLVETDTSVRSLARQSGVSRRTLENWLSGRTLQPRRAEPLLRVAVALRLTRQETDRLLHAANQPKLNQLQQKGVALPRQLMTPERRADSLPRHNLPAATTPFVGRQAARRELAALLAQPDVRLVTVGGLGGSGKTRLALETTRQLVERFEHGVYFVPLDSAGDEAGFWSTIRGALNVPGDPTGSTQDLVENYLRNKELLLVLDDFEHLLPLAHVVRRLLEQTPRLTLLVTSRQALTLQAEHLYILDGLSWEEGVASPAYRLFIQTARRHVPDFAPSSAEIEAINQLCARVEGLPLALELTASWMNVLSPTAVLHRLDSDLLRSTVNTIDRAPRQKSLWHLFDYSWQMLSADEQEAAMRLAILRGTFLPEMAMALADRGPSLLQRLVQSSFVRRVDGNRLQIHPLVRQFLAEQAMETGLTRAMQEERFAEITLDWVARECGLLRETFEAIHYQRISAEWAHFERAWWLAVEQERTDLLESCLEILHYFESRGTWSQGIELFDETRHRLSYVSERMQARLDEATAIMLLRLFDIQTAINLARRSLKTLEELGVAEDDMAGTYARLVLHSARYVFIHRNFDDELATSIRQISNGRLDVLAGIASHIGYGIAAFGREEFAHALHHFHEILSTYGPDLYTVPVTRCFMGLAYQALEQESSAREQFRLGLEGGLQIGVYPAVVVATYELRLMESDDPTFEQVKETIEGLALQLGSRRAVGQIAIHNAIEYFNLGLFNRGRRLARIAMSMLWNEVDNAERNRNLAAVLKAYSAFGLARSAPRLVDMLAPKIELAEITGD